MARKRFTAEQIIPKLREAEVELARGRTVAFSSQFSVLALGTLFHQSWERHAVSIFLRAVWAARQRVEAQVDVLHYVFVDTADRSSQRDVVADHVEASPWLMEILIASVAGT
mgnify:CR=1 FL=1